MQRQEHCREEGATSFCRKLSPSTYKLHNASSRQQDTAHILKAGSSLHRIRDCGVKKPKHTSTSRRSGAGLPHPHEQLRSRTFFSLCPVSMMECTVHTPTVLVSHIRNAHKPRQRFFLSSRNEDNKIKSLPGRPQDYCSERVPRREELAEDTIPERTALLTVWTATQWIANTGHIP